MKKLLVCLLGFVLVCGLSLTAKAATHGWRKDHAGTIPASTTGRWLRPADDDLIVPKEDEHNPFSEAERGALAYLAHSLGIDADAIQIVGSVDITPQGLDGASWRLVTLEYEGKEYYVKTTIGIYPGAEWQNFEIVEPPVQLTGLLKKVETEPGTVNIIQAPVYQLVDPNNDDLVLIYGGGEMSETLAKFDGQIVDITGTWFELEGTKLLKAESVSGIQYDYPEGLLPSTPTGQDLDPRYRSLGTELPSEPVPMPEITEVPIVDTFPLGPDAYGWEPGTVQIEVHRNELITISRWDNPETGESLQIVTTVKIHGAKKGDLRYVDLGQGRKSEVVSRVLTYTNPEGESIEVVLEGKGADWEFTDSWSWATMDYPSSVIISGREYTNKETGETFQITIDFVRDSETGQYSTSVTWEYSNPETGAGFKTTFSYGTIVDDPLRKQRSVEPLPPVGPVPAVGLLEID